MPPGAAVAPAASIAALAACGGCAGRASPAQQGECSAAVAAPLRTQGAGEATGGRQRRRRRQQSRRWQQRMAEPQPSSGSVPCDRVVHELCEAPHFALLVWSPLCSLYRCSGVAGHFQKHRNQSVSASHPSSPPAACRRRRCCISVRRELPGVNWKAGADFKKALPSCCQPSAEPSAG